MARMRLISMHVQGLTITQIIGAIFILGHAGFGLSLVSYYTPNKPHTAYAFSVATSVFTLLLLAYVLVASIAINRFYHKLAVLAIQLFLTLFWLVTLAIQADLVKDYQEINGRGNTYATWSDYYAVLFDYGSYDMGPTSTLTAVMICATLSQSDGNECLVMEFMTYFSLAVCTIMFILFIATCVLVCLAHKEDHTAPAAEDFSGVEDPSASVAMKNEPQTVTYQVHPTAPP